MYNTSTSVLAPMSASPLTPLSESVTMSSPSIQDGYPDHMGNAAPPAVGSVDSDQFPHPVEGISRAHEVVYVHNCIIIHLEFQQQVGHPMFRQKD